MVKKRADRERSPFGRRMFESRERAGLKQMQVRKALGISQGTLSELEALAASSGKVVEFAGLYGVDAMWLATGEGIAPSWTSEQPSTEGVEFSPVAQPMTLSPADDLQTITLGGIMDWDNLPAAFEAAMPDDALAPDYLRGTVFVWSRKKKPKEGSVVLLRDSRDRPHVREYQPGTEDGQWAAAATKRGYPSFDHQNSKIMAVARFGELP